MRCKRKGKGKGGCVSLGEERRVLKKEEETMGQAEDQNEWKREKCVSLGEERRVLKKEEEIMGQVEDQNEWKRE